MALGAHEHRGVLTSKARRLQSKVGRVITVERLEELLGGKQPPIPEALANPRPIGKTTKHTFRMETK